MVNSLLLVKALLVKELKILQSIISLSDVSHAIKKTELPNPGSPAIFHKTRGFPSPSHDEFDFVGSSKMIIS